MEQTIKLLSPIDCGVSLMTALERRRTIREFSSEPLSLEHLSGLLWAASGINRSECGKRTAPSALALYPLTVYAFFKEGVYRYDVQSHSLEFVCEGNYMAITGKQEFVATAPLNLVYVADMSLYRDIPPYLEDIKRFLAGQDAAGCVQNANLWAAANGLAAVTRGSFNESELLELLSLDSSRYTVVMAQSLGNPLL